MVFAECLELKWARTQFIKNFSYLTDRPKVGRRFQITLFLIVSSLLHAGCTAAIPEVTSLLSNLTGFKLNESQIQIQSLSELSSLNVSATCTSQDSGFEYEIPTVAAGVWMTVPTTPSGMFTSLSQNCASGAGLSFTLDLSAISTFNTMVLGDSRDINFRNVTSLASLVRTETLTITYSLLQLSGDRPIFGHGVNTPLTSGTYQLRGHLISVGDNDSSTSSTYTLKGRAVFQ